MTGQVVLGDAGLLRAGRWRWARALVWMVLLAVLCIAAYNLTAYAVLRAGAVLSGATFATAADAPEWSPGHAPSRGHEGDDHGEENLCCLRLPVGAGFHHQSEDRRQDRRGVLRGLRQQAARSGHQAEEVGLNQGVEAERENLSVYARRRDCPIAGAACAH